MFSARLGFNSSYTPLVQDLMMPSTSSPYLNGYSWSDNNGFGSRYTNPSTLPTTTQGSSRFKPDNTAILFSTPSSPYTNAYQWTLGSGFGTKYSNPGTALPTGSNRCRWTDNTNIVFGLLASPYLTSYAFSSAGGYGTRYGPPATLLPAAPQDIGINSQGTVVSVAHPTTPFISAYQYTSGVGFGTKYSNPGTLPTAAQRITNFLLDDNFLGTGDTTLRTYSWDNTTGFGIVSASYSVGSNPVFGMGWVGNGGTNRTLFSAGNNFIMGNLPMSSSVASLSTGSTSAQAFNVSGYKISVGISAGTTPYVKVARMSPNLTGFSGLFANPGTLPASSCNDIAWTYPQ